MRWIRKISLIYVRMTKSKVYVLTKNTSVARTDKNCGNEEEGKIGEGSHMGCASIAREYGPRYFGSSGAYSRRPSKGVKSWLTMVCRVVTFSEGPLGGK